jgi:primosomal protein N' (replication factor Y)
MQLCDIVFPQNLPPLTYKIPDSLLPDIKAGQLVMAPLRGKEKKGIVLRVEQKPDTGIYKLKPVSRITKTEPLLSPDMIKLLDWSADYYITNHGTMLKSMVFREALNPSRNPAPRSPRTFPPDEPLSEYNPELLERVATSVNRGEYRTFLFHAGDEGSERDFVIRLAGRFQNTIILVPEVRDAELLFSLLTEIHGGRVCMYHSDMRMSERTDSFEGLYAGRYDIVIGTRPVVFAPLSSPSLIIVMKEHNAAYKQEESPRYHGRDVAVMRGFTGRFPVLLTSATPSTESIYNAMAKKYILLKTESGKGADQPKVTLIDLRRGKSIAPFITSRLVDILRSEIKTRRSGSGALVVIQRRGSGMLRCDNCGEIELCPNCMTPLVLHKGEGLLCHPCGFRKDIPQNCNRCGSFKLSLFGAGTERVEEELGRLLGVGTVRFDSDIQKVRRRKAEPAKGKETGDSNRHIIIGTLTRKNRPVKDLAVVAFLNPDIMLNLPEARATERLVQEVFSLRGLVSGKGRIILQTENPWHPVYKLLKRWDFTGLIRYELKIRKKLSLPPYTRLISLDIYPGIRNQGITSDDIGTLVERATGELLAEKGDSEFVVVGPYSVIPKIKGFNRCFRVMLKGEKRNNLKVAGRLIKDAAEAAGMTLRIDVDPVSF